MVFEYFLQAIATNILQKVKLIITSESKNHISVYFFFTYVIESKFLKSGPAQLWYSIR